MEDSLTVGDYITSVDNCAVKNIEEWKSCLKQTIVKQQHGFCTDMLTMTRKNTFLGKKLPELNNNTITKCQSKITKV